MRVLIASPILPWPLSEGGRAAQFRTLLALREDCSFTLVAPVTTPAEEAHAEEFAAIFPNVRVVPVRCFHLAPRRQSWARQTAAKFKAKTLAWFNHSSSRA